MADGVTMVAGEGAGTMNINQARRVRSVSGAKKRKKRKKSTTKRKSTSRKTRKRSK